MSFLFMKGGKQKPAYTGLQLQTSSSSIPVTLAWGANRFAPNLIWYDGFKAHKQKKKAGKGAPKQTTYTYTVDVILALGEGQMQGVGKVWKDKDQKNSISDVGLSFFDGSNTQAPWGYLVSQYPSAALAYRQTAYLAAASYDLGDQATLPNHTFEVFSRQYNTGPGGYGAADCAIIIDEFLTSPQFGVGFDDSRVDQSSLMSGPDAPTTGDSAYQTYCRAMGFGMSPVLSDTEPARDTLTRWLQITNSELVWTGYSVKFMPYAYADVTGNGVTFLANDTPVYTLTDDDYVGDREDPVKVDRIGPEDAHNYIKVIIHDRLNSYNELPIEWKDQSLIEQYGERAPGSLKAIELTDRDTASKAVELYAARKAYIRNTYKFTLGPEFVLLEPMDLLMATDPRIGPVLVQIATIEEDDDGNLKIEAKQVLNQTATTSGFVVQPPAGNNQNTGITASAVNPPIIFEPPANLSQGTAQVWAAVSGGDGTTFDPNWGGCEVFVSADGGTNYQNIGVIDSPARMGKTTATLPAYGGANPDTVNTLKVNLGMSGAELIGVTPDEMADGTTLCYVGGEFLSYQNAALTAAYAYDLSPMYRGLYQSTPGSHASASNFARLDENIFVFDLPPEYIGKALKFKFQSYNIFGQGFQDLSACTPYDYTPLGTGYAIGAPVSVGLTFTNVLQADGTNIIVGNVTVGASPGPYLDHYDVEITTDGGTTWNAISAIGASGTKTTFQPALAATNYRARARAVSSAVGGIPSAWVQSAIVNSGALGGTVPNPPTALVVTAGDYSNSLTWNAPVAGSAVAGYRIYAIHGASGSFGSAGLIGTSPSPFFVHSGLGASDTWRYWVVAYNAAGNSTELGPINQTTNAAGGGGIEVKDEGSSILNPATILNFIGAGVTASNAGGGQVDIAIPGGGGGGDSTPTGWEVAYDQTISVGVANIDVDVSNYDDIIVSFVDVTTATNGSRSILVSTDGGATYWTTSGNYRWYSFSGVLTNNTTVAVHAVSTTAARGGLFLMSGLRSSTSFKPWQTPNNSDHGDGIFVGSLLPVTNIRLFNSPTGSAGNLTGGRVIIYGRRNGSGTNYLGSDVGWNSTTSTSQGATVGNVFTATASATIGALEFIIVPPSAGIVYRAVVAELDGSNNVVAVSIGDVTWTSPDTALQTARVAFTSPPVLTAGKRYLIGVNRSGGANNASVGVQAGNTGPFGYSMQGITYDGYAELQQATPAIGGAVTLTVSPYRFAIRAIYAAGALGVANSYLWGYSSSAGSTSTSSGSGKGFSFTVAEPTTIDRILMMPDGQGVATDYTLYLVTLSSNTAAGTILSVIDTGTLQNFNVATGTPIPMSQVLGSRRDLVPGTVYGVIVFTSAASLRMRHGSTTLTPMTPLAALAGRGVIVTSTPAPAVAYTVTDVFCGAIRQVT